MTVLFFPLGQKCPSQQESGFLVQLVPTPSQDAGGGGGAIPVVGPRVGVGVGPGVGPGVGGGVGPGVAGAGPGGPPPPPPPTAIQTIAPVSSWDST